jgi:hypothetical protein
VGRKCNKNRKTDRRLKSGACQGAGPGFLWRSDLKIIPRFCQGKKKERSCHKKRRAFCKPGNVKGFKNFFQIKNTALLTVRVGGA